MIALADYWASSELNPHLDDIDSYSRQHLDRGAQARPESQSASWKPVSGMGVRQAPANRSVRSAITQTNEAVSRGTSRREDLVDTVSRWTDQPIMKATRGMRVFGLSSASKRLGLHFSPAGSEPLEAPDTRRSRVPRADRKPVVDEVYSGNRPIQQGGTVRAVANGSRRDQVGRSGGSPTRRLARREERGDNDETEDDPARIGVPPSRYPVARERDPTKLEIGAAGAGLFKLVFIVYQETRPRKLGNCSFVSCSASPNDLCFERWVNRTSAYNTDKTSRAPMVGLPSLSSH